jgi:bacillithiol synthase
MAILQERNTASLFEKYRSKQDAACELFDLHPLNEEDWTRRASTLDETAGRRADRRSMVNVLKNYQTQLPCHAAAAQSLDKLERPDSLVVVGGQQAGLFGGALLIYYKALTVIQTAKQAEQRLGRPVVPVFWIAGEDHDFDEANHVIVQSSEESVRRVRIERPDGPRQAVSRTALTSEAWLSALQELATQLPDTAHKPKLLERLQSYVADCPSLSLAFARLLADWFGPQGLVLLDADDDRLRSLEGKMFLDFIQDNEGLEVALKEGERLVAERGFPLQAETAEGGANLFLHHEQGRLLLHRDGDFFVDRRGFVKLSREQLLRLTDESPNVLSTNALTRPLMQDYVLPVLAAVLGPSELAYWGILGPAFQKFGMSMPLLIPRSSFTYLEQPISKLLTKYGLSAEEAISDWETKREEWLKSQDDWQLEQLFGKAKDDFDRLYAPVLERVVSLQPGLSKLAELNRDKIIEQIAYMQSKSMDALVKRHEASLRQWDRIKLALQPLDRPQERVYGTVHFWNRYGSEWLNRWADIPFEPTGGHRLVEGFTTT